MTPLQKLLGAATGTGRWETYKTPAMKWTDIIIPGVRCVIRDIPKEADAKLICLAVNKLEQMVEALQEAKVCRHCKECPGCMQRIDAALQAVGAEEAK